MKKSLQILFILVIWLSAGIDSPLLAQSDINEFHYEPVEGKSLGIWPTIIMSEFDYLDSYKNELGIEYVLLQPKTSDGKSSSYYYDLAIEAGYTPDNILIQITDLNYEWASKNLDVKNYYLGEPVEHDCFGNNSNDHVSHIYPPTELTSISNKIKSDDSTANLILDGYKRCSHFTIAGDIADQVMFSGYTEWNEFFSVLSGSGVGFTAWLPHDDNQSSSWYNMAEVFDSKFQKSWVHGEGDEYAALFETADSIGLQAIFFYALPLIIDDNIREFCEIANQSGWLNKIYSIEFFPPYNLLAEEIEAGVLNLTWEDSTNYATGYVIEKKASADTSFTFLDSLESHSVSYLDSNVIENQIFHYRIYSYTDERNSTYSDTATVTTSVIPITAPSDLQAELEENNVMLSWQDNSDNEDNFIIERKLNDSDLFNLIESTRMDAAQYIDSSITEDGIYQYRIFAMNEFTRSENSDIVEINIVLSSVEYPPEIYSLELYQNYPSPFNPSTVIEYSVPVNIRQYAGVSSQEQTIVTLKIYDVLGRELATLVNEWKQPGRYQVKYNAEGLSSGMYYYSLSMNSHVMTKKMILVK